jgi:hypothetical protein
VADLEPSLLHTTAITALAVSQLDAMGSTLAVYLDEVPRVPSYPYVVFWSSPAAPYAPAERMSGWGQDVETVTQATIAALARADVLGAVDRLAWALHRRKPAIAGRVPGDIEMDGAPSAIAPDRDPVPAPGGMEVWTAPTFWRLASSPTTNII